MSRRLAPILLVLLAACADPGGEVRSALGVGTPRERFEHRLREARLHESALGRRWLAAGDSAARAADAIAVPFREAGWFDAAEARAVAYRWPVRRGQRALVVVAAEAGDSAGGVPLFVDAFRRDSSGALHREASLDSAAGTLALVAEEDGELVVRLQPEPLRAVRYTLTVRVAPLAEAFPVAGRGEKAAQSFWGANRDGGRRSHQGVDIFAPRGTPVVAATPGVVTSVGENRLGGNVVWVVEPGRRWAFYYAHLDRQLVRAGTRVAPGDTLGLVGNTGNARTTPPHLHFGVYRTGRRGAVDPWPFVAQPRGTAPALTAPLDPPAGLAQLGDDRALGTVVAARGARWVARTLDGAEREVAPARVRPVGRAGGPAIALAAGARLHLRPDSGAFVVARALPDERAVVLGRAGSWCLVRTPRGQAWAGCGPG